jgi:predicted nuclease of predicted toxin-antitoxin system
LISTDKGEDALFVPCRASRYHAPPMRWLLHGNLTPAVAEALARHKQESRTPADVGLSPESTAQEVFDAARKAQLEILTADANLAQAPFEQGARFSRTMVLLNVEGGDVEQDDALDRLFERYKRLSPGRLYTVTGSRVKIRQLPGR